MLIDWAGEYHKTRRGHSSVDALGHSWASEWVDPFGPRMEVYSLVGLVDLILRKTPT